MFLFKSVLNTAEARLYYTNWVAEEWHSPEKIQRQRPSADKNGIAEWPAASTWMRAESTSRSRVADWLVGRLISFFTRLLVAYKTCELEMWQVGRRLHAVYAINLLN